MASTDTSQFLRDLAGALSRRKRTILLLTGFSVLAATFYAYTFLPVYEASATILVKVGRESSTPQSDVVRPPPIVTTLNTAEVVSSEIEFLEARYLAEEVVQTLGEGAFASPQTPPVSLWQKSRRYVKQAVRSVVERADAVLVWLDLKEALTARERLTVALLENLSARVVQNTNTIRVTFRSRNPQLAAEVVKTALSIYLRHHVSTHRAADVVDFLTAETRDSKARLEQAEARLRDFKGRFGISSLEEQRSHLLRLHAEIRSDLRAVDVELARLNESVGGMQRLAAERGVDLQEADVTKPSAVVDALKLKLTDLRANRDALRLKYTDGSPFVESVEREIRDVQSELKREEAQQAVVVEIGALRSKKAELERLSTGTLAELARLNQLEHELRPLTRSVKENGELYDAYFERAETARTLQAMDTANITNVSVIDPPYVPILPVRTIPFIPQRIFTIVLALFAGLFLSVPVVAMQEAFDDAGVPRP